MKRFALIENPTWAAEWGQLVGDYYVTSWTVTRSGREGAETEFFRDYTLASEAFERTIEAHK